MWSLNQQALGQAPKFFRLPRWAYWAGCFSGVHLFLSKSYCLNTSQMLVYYRGGKGAIKQGTLGLLFGGIWQKNWFSTAGCLQGSLSVWWHLYGQGRGECFLTTCGRLAFFPPRSWNIRARGLLSETVNFLLGLVIVRLCSFRIVELSHIWLFIDKRKEKNHRFCEIVVVSFLYE